MIIIFSLSLSLRKREEEAKKRVLNNPVKMKQLHEVLVYDYTYKLLIVITSY